MVGNTRLMQIEPLCRAYIHGWMQAAKRKCIGRRVGGGMEVEAEGGASESVTN